MSSEAHIRAQAKYDKHNTKSVMLKLNLTSDSDIIAKLQDMDNKQGYIKDLIRRDLRGSGDILSLDSIKYLIQPIARKYKLDKVFVFGSYGRGEETASSDLDLLIDGADIHTMEEYLELKDSLSKTIGKDVDIVLGETVRKNVNTRSGRRFMEHFERDKVLIYG